MQSWLTVAITPADRASVLDRALARAARHGARVRRAAARPDDPDIAAASPATPTRAGADVVVCLAWPDVDAARGPALAAMARGTPVIVLETAATAGWPALDPQTWQPRPPAIEPPAVISIDPRDEEHSLMLAIRRLASDADLRARLGAAGRAWAGTIAKTQERA